MGVLHYLQREDETKELFALNKFSGYAEYYKHGEWVEVDEFVSWLTQSESDDYYSPEMAEWLERIERRVRSWAQEKRVKLLSEYCISEEPGDIHYGLTYDEHRALITGSVHDSDYEDNGVTYRPGSAW